MFLHNQEISSYYFRFVLVLHDFSIDKTVIKKLMPARHKYAHRHSDTHARAHTRAHTRTRARIHAHTHAHTRTHTSTNTHRSSYIVFYVANRLVVGFKVCVNCTP